MSALSLSLTNTLTNKNFNKFPARESKGVKNITTLGMEAEYTEYTLKQLLVNNYWDKQYCVVHGHHASQGEG